MENVFIYMSELIEQNTIAAMTLLFIAIAGIVFKTGKLVLSLTLYVAIVAIGFILKGVPVLALILFAIVFMLEAFPFAIEVNARVHKKLFKDRKFT